MALPGYRRPSSPPDFEAELLVLRREEGGRSAPLPSGYRCAIDLAAPDLNTAQFEFTDTGELGPGSRGPALVWLLQPQLLTARLAKGAAFRLFEGGRRVAEGTILRVLRDDLRRDTRP